ncbi:interleukin-17C-like isoform X2 [Mugil cephalus]|uniref:interleukin-17C-like isoform X2 n=1 Tax=Mugil cephalus TaxID=48193 RepID=UPI001FB62CD2|nr:interleukin-17C-like isoform X2 [Mugil cephalus]
MCLGRGQGGSGSAATSIQALFKAAPMEAPDTLRPPLRSAPPDMTPTGFHMIFLGSLLCFGRASSARCVDSDNWQRREKAWQLIKNQTSGNATPDAKRTCDQAAREMSEDPSDRALSPWRLRTDRDDTRFPPEIYVAECLCQGCIIGQRENLSYNSVKVHASLLVLRKSQCPRDPSKYKLTKELIKVPVACTCVRPVIRNHHR